MNFLNTENLTSSQRWTNLHFLLLTQLNKFEVENCLLVSLITLNDQNPQIFNLIILCIKMRDEHTPLFDYNTVRFALVSRKEHFYTDDKIKCTFVACVS